MLRNHTSRWPTACVWCRHLACGLGALLVSALLAGPAAAQTVSVSAAGFAPAVTAPDPGPEMLVGAEDPKEAGTHFDWVDLLLSGASPRYRGYFDRLDHENFHYLDRSDQQVTLGLCEAGVEQVLAQGPLPPAAEALRIARHGTKMGVFADTRLVLAAFDDRRMGGTVGLRNLASGTALSLAARRREDVRFSDDFMREEKETSTWRKVFCAPERGDFAIKSLRNPLMSANAFMYMGVGREVLSVTGEPWWDNYRFEVSVRGPETGRLGVVFAYQDEKNYGLFRWTARTVRQDGSPLDDGLREMVRVRDGQEEVLSSTKGGYLPDQWYRLEALVSHARVRIIVDGHPKIEIVEPRLACGGVGLWCDVDKPDVMTPDPRAQRLNLNSVWELMRKHAVFDDVHVASVDGYEDDFRTPGPLAHGWLAGLGNWRVEAAESGKPGLLSIRPPGFAVKSLVGDSRWTQYRVACDILPSEGDRKSTRLNSSHDV